MYLRVLRCRSLSLCGKCKTDNAAEILRSKGFEVYTNNNHDIHIKIDYNDQVLEILSILRHECIDYENIDVRRSNLEEIFLNLTGSKLLED